MLRQSLHGCTGVTNVLPHSEVSPVVVYVFYEVLTYLCLADAIACVYATGDSATTSSVHYWPWRNEYQTDHASNRGRNPLP